VTDDDDQMIGIIAGAIVAFLALLAAVIVFCVVCRRRLRKFPDDKVVASVAPTSRLPINFTGRSDVILTSAGTTRKLSSGSVPMYGSHNSPAAAMLLPPGGTDLYDDEDPVKMASDGCYGRHIKRQLPDLPRIPVDSAGTIYTRQLSTVMVGQVKVYISAYDVFLNRNKQLHLITLTSVTSRRQSTLIAGYKPVEIVLV